jgi:hypothetical protein
VPFSDEEQTTETPMIKSLKRRWNRRGPATSAFAEAPVDRPWTCRGMNGEEAGRRNDPAELVKSARSALRPLSPPDREWFP